ncbi:hypothetical protein [Hamadaea tsunoensis]|uniref:hypothetical protein n=1 Tax=Hamadaea tsunoensis TaxID=53368 RepID=UPI0003F8E822|nr:hypothetical protein [Hamadaea tsunoensis]
MTTEREGGGARFVRGLLFAVLIVAVIVLLAVFWRQTLDGAKSVGGFVGDRFPGDTGGRVAVVLYLVVAAVVGVLFSKAGHFTAYGIALGIIPLLWFLFWEGFPPLGLKPSWAADAGLTHLNPTNVIVWAVVADIVVTLVFVPLELREGWRARKHRLADAD